MLGLLFFVVVVFVVVVVLSGEFLLHIPCWFLFFSAEFLLYISCWLHFCLESFSYRSRAGFIFLWGVSLTHPVLASFLSGEFLLQIPCWLHFYLGSFSYRSRAGFIFIWGVSLTHPMQKKKSFFFSFLFIYFYLFYLGSFSYTSRAGFFFMWWASLECNLLWRQPLKKRAGWKMAQKKKCEKVALKTEKEPYNTLYKAEPNQTGTEWQLATEKKGE